MMRVAMNLQFLSGLFSADRPRISRVLFLLAAVEVERVQNNSRISFNATSTRFAKRA